MNNLTGAARRVTRNFDQFSVICVFGSVVGCVVLPLMVQSMESFIITFVVLCLTAKPLRGHLFPTTGNNQSQESERRRSKDKDDNKKSRRSSPKKKPVQVVGTTELVQRQREEDLRKQEQQRLEERERRLEEKREKKARKKEERLQRKEDEKKEKEKEDQLRRERQEARAQRKREEKEKKQKSATFEMPTFENIQTIVNETKPLKRERKHSTSSSASSISAHSTSSRHHHGKSGAHHRHAAPFRASSDPEISVVARSSPTPGHWQTSHTLPVVHGSSHWYTDIANRMFPSLPIVTSTAGYQQLPQPQLIPQGSYFSMYPPTTSFQQGAGSGQLNNQTSTCWSVPPTICTRNQEVGEPLQHLVPQAAWLQANGTHQVQQQGGVQPHFSPAPGTMGGAQQQNRFTGGQSSGSINGLPDTATLCSNGSLFNNSGLGTNTGAGTVGDRHDGSYYSLFSGTGGSHSTPFSAVEGLLNLDTSAEHMLYQASSSGSPLSVSSDVSDGQNSVGAFACGGLQDDQSSTSFQRSVESVGPASQQERLYDDWPNL